MPRTKTTAAMLEHQAAEDSQIDESWRDQSIPTFVDEPQNGHVPEGIRPSERCGTPSPLGIGCTLRVEHAGLHSWTPPPILSPELGTETGQALLPGTPEPEQPEPTDYDIPFEAQFQHRDYQSAPGIKAIAERHIAATEEFGHLRGIEIRYFWKRRGGLKAGNPRLGALQKVTGLAGYALGGPVYTLWLAADHCRDLKLEPEKIEALVFKCLCSSAVDPDDHDSYRIVGPDVEAYSLEIQRYGLWSQDLREAGLHIKQLGLLDTLALPEPDEGANASDEEDEGDE